MSDFIFVSCLSELAVAQERLLASPCLQAGGHRLVMHVNVRSAASAVNQVLDSRPDERWAVWLHQDVFLPGEWDTLFAQRLQEALARWPRLAVVGVYGVQGAGAECIRAGHVLDRGKLLREPAPLPHPVDSLDELLFAVRTDVGLRLDPALGFDFYATDLVLQAQAAGWECAVVDAYCEHWSSTPEAGAVSRAMAMRVGASGSVFENKWAHRLPISTPCFDIDRVGAMHSVAERFCAAESAQETR